MTKHRPHVTTHVKAEVALQVIQAAELDVLSLDWSGEEHYVATGADGGKVHVYDVRKMGASEKAVPLLEFQQFTRHLTAVLTVAFSPRKKVRSSTHCPCFCPCFCALLAVCAHIDPEDTPAPVSARPIVWLG